MGITIGLLLFTIIGITVWYFGKQPGGGLILAVGTFACFAVLAATFLTSSFPWRDNMRESHLNGYGVTQFQNEISP